MSISWGILSKYKNVLYGVSILWIMLLHGLVRGTHGELDPLIQWLTPILVHGNCGVDIFLFLSGIFLYFSFKNDYNIKHFYIRRFLRILFPHISIIGLYYGYINIICEHNVARFFANITLFSFWFGHVHFVWFIGAILFFYILYPVIYSVIYKIKNLSYRLVIVLLLICIIYIVLYFLNHGSNLLHVWFNNVEIALTRLPIFILGCYVGNLVYEDKKISSLFIFITFIGCVIGIFLFYKSYPVVPNYRILYFFVSPCFTIWAAIIVDVFSNRYVNLAFSKLGMCSLELYLLQMSFQNLTLKFHFYGQDRIAAYHTYLVYCVLGAIVVAFLIHPLLEEGRKRILRKIATN